MTATMELTKVESKLFARDPIFLFFGLVFPGLILLLLGLFFPGFTDPASELGGRSYLEAWASVALALGVATLGLVTLPPILGTYRQFGILRRFRTTPVHPARLLSAQLIVHIVIAVTAAMLAIGVAVIGFDVTFPELPIMFVLMYLLAAASMFSLGLLVGARARTTASASAIGMAIYFPMLFFAGVWVPRSVMSDALLTVSDLTPLGSAVQALEDAWFGITPSALNIVVMVAWTVIGGFVAVRSFRWE